jgi:5-methyltetrahydropteroyltriglutamate--homocysteine methyltransferase
MPTNDYGTLFPTSVVGSVPRPDFVRDLINDEKISPQEYDRRMEAAVRYVVAMQENAGLDIITDGEWWRKSYIGVIAELAHGFEVGANPADGRPWTVVTGKLSPKKPGTIAREVAVLKKLTKSKIKATLPAPALLGERMWEKDKSSKAYPNRDDFVRDCAVILRKELELLKDAGATIVQIDDPHLCLFVDKEVRAKYKDADAEAMHCVGLINRVFEGVKGTRRAVHLCRRNKGRRGWVGEGSYDAIMPALKALDVDQLMMEFTIPAAGDTRCLRELPESVNIGLGCVDCRGEVIDEPATIVARVEQAMEHVDKRRITLAPDCGFAPGNAADIPVDEAFAKLQNMVLAAELLRAKHG